MKNKNKKASRAEAVIDPRSNTLVAVAHRLRVLELAFEGQAISNREVLEKVNGLESQMEAAGEQFVLETKLEEVRENLQQQINAEHSTRRSNDQCITVKYDSNIQTLEDRVKALQSQVADLINNHKVFRDKLDKLVDSSNTAMSNLKPDGQEFRAQVTATGRHSSDVKLEVGMPVITTDDLAGTPKGTKGVVVPFSGNGKRVRLNDNTYQFFPDYYLAIDYEELCKRRDAEQLHLKDGPVWKEGKGWAIGWVTNHPAVLFVNEGWCYLHEHFQGKLENKGKLVDVCQAIMAIKERGYDNTLEVKQIDWLLEKIVETKPKA
jgi:hypothetical protein